MFNFGTAEELHPRGSFAIAGNTDAAEELLQFDLNQGWRSGMQGAGEYVYFNQIHHQCSEIAF